MTNNISDVMEALIKEAQFTKEMLGSGATQIRRANYAQKGIYFQAFTSLSTGLERIGKLCLILDFYIDNQGKFPDLKYLKEYVGHDILLLYVNSIEIIKRRSIKFHFLDNLDKDVYQSILSVLSQFAKGDRYSNIDMLVNNPKSSDPVAAWFEKIDTVIFERDISIKRKKKIIQNAKEVDVVSSGFVRVHFTAEVGTEITEVFEASFRTGMQEAVASYRQLYVLHIIRFWAELLEGLQYLAMEVNKEDIPFFNEGFAPFFNPDSYLRTRKTWDKF